MGTSTITPRLRHAVTSLSPYVAGRRATSAHTAPLASNESHFPPLPSVLAEVAASAGRLNRYPDSASVQLRERIADHVGVSADEVAVGPGSVGVLQQIIESVCDAGDEVVFAWRSFEAYPLLVTLAGATPVPVPLTADEGHDLDAMLAAIGPRTRLVLLCTPNNPTGVTIPGAELDRFLDAVPSETLVVIDEAYLEYVTGDPLDALARYRRHPNVCVLRTFSKALGARFDAAGWTRLNPSHVETVFRNGVMGAYADGRKAQMTQPAVLAARPYWQILGVDDARTRKTHGKAHTKVLPASDPFFDRAGPPFGHACRCRTISRSANDLKRLGLTPTIGAALSGLPDEGWDASGSLL